MADPAPARRRVAGVRVRTTAATVVIVAVALILAAMALVVTLRGALTDRVRDAAELRADDVVAALESRTPADALELPADDDGVVQVVTRDGIVLAASANLGQDRPLARIDDDDDTRVEGVPLRDVDDDGELDDDVDREDMLVVASDASTDDGSVLVLAGRVLEPVDDSVSVTTRALLVGIPVLVLLVGVVTWIMVGRALAPVERARADVDDISEHDLHLRVPEPPTDDEIGRLVRTLNRLLGRLEGSQLRQRRFVSDASHELRSPVASIRHHAEVAMAHPDTTSVTDLANEVLQEDVRLERLVDDLIWIARADERGAELTHVPVDLDDLVLDEARRTRSVTDRVIDVSSVSAGRVRGDPGQLRRLVRNLVDNATRHARTQVVLSLHEAEDRVVLRVDDDGPGIPTGDRARVFDRFVRLDDARARDDGGSGLGLAIVGAIVHAHGGGVSVGEAPTGGARFDVVLPKAG